MKNWREDDLGDVDQTLEICSIGLSITMCMLFDKKFVGAKVSGRWNCRRAQLDSYTCRRGSEEPLTSQILCWNLQSFQCWQSEESSWLDQTDQVASQVPVGEERIFGQKKQQQKNTVGSGFNFCNCLKFQWLWRGCSWSTMSHYVTWSWRQNLNRLLLKSVLERIGDAWGITCVG